MKAPAPPRPALQTSRWRQVDWDRVIVRLLGYCAARTKNGLITISKDEGLCVQHWQGTSPGRTARLGSAGRTGPCPAAAAPPSPATARHGTPRQPRHGVSNPRRLKHHPTKPHAQRKHGAAVRNNLGPASDTQSVITLVGAEGGVGRSSLGAGSPSCPHAGTCEGFV